MEVVQESIEQNLDTPSDDDAVYGYQPTVSPERMAWGVLLIAFALFCTLTISTVLGVYFFLFESTISIPTTLRVSQGTVGITGSDLIEAVEREQEELTSSVTSISTDSQSQATIQFWEQPSEDIETIPLISSITLQRNTFVTFNRASSPRFEWSTNPYDIELSKLTGQLDVLVIGADENAFVMRITTEQGVIINLNRNGRYSIIATDDEVRIVNFDGEAVVFFSDDFTNNRLVSTGQEVVVRLGNRSIDQKSTIENVLTNSSFSLQPVTLGVDNEPIMPPGWGCRFKQNDLPRGTFTIEEFDGRYGVRVKRLDNATSNGEVGCVQPFGTEGLDVTGYESIRIVSTFYLNYQSLSKCGIAGSECPLMILLTYDDDLGITRRWFRGFYYDELLSNEYPTRCASCLQDHQNINEKVWYTFESDNLFSLIDEERHPKRIRSIEFYASGHQFDTIISEMMILVTPIESAGETASE